jgi:hypothetical protein
MRKHLLIVAFLSLLLAACGGTGTTGSSSSAGKLSIQMKPNTASKLDMKKDFEAKKGVISPLSLNVDSKPIIRYMIDLTDFEYEANASAKPKDDKQTLVTIALFGKSGDTAETPLRTGTFELAPQYAKVDEKYDRISNVYCTVFKDGKAEEYTFTAANAKGTVKINSVSGDTVTGEIDLTQDNGGSIKGNFTAQMKKK